jgi:hypothetical protein
VKITHTYDPETQTQYEVHEDQWWEDACEGLQGVMALALLTVRHVGKGVLWVWRVWRT